MDKDSSRNTIAFVVTALVMVVLYQVFILGPAQKRREQALLAERAAAARGHALQPQAAAPFTISRDQAAASSPRVSIDTPALKGSIALVGARIDDLFLKQYPETLAKNSPPVELFRPRGAPNAYFASFGWTGAAGAPDPNTVWQVQSGGVLKPGQPVVLRAGGPGGVQVVRTIRVDDRFMFTISDQVTNTSATPVTLAPYASVQRWGLPTLSPTPIIHEGAVGVMGGSLKLIPFKDWKKRPEQQTPTTGGWLGVTDKYWLAALIPDQKTPVTGDYRVTTLNGVDVYEADFTAPPRTLGPGQSTTETTRLFAGAKKVSVLRDYEKSLGIPRLDEAVDWGNFWFLTRPFFWLLSLFQSWVGNFGLALLMVTVVVKAATFPLANRSYASMSRMKKLAPEVEAIKKKFPDDPAKQQQETMALYQREKVNPLGGCLPALIPIPIFYALYKVLFVTIEMRHAPFFGWIHDLSAPDPTTIVNLFGLLPYNPALLPGIGPILDGPLHIGAWPILYGLVMWLSQNMNSTTGIDPTQRFIMQAFPLVFTFMLAHSPAGILIYWTWSALLSTLQQYVIMHRYKAENPIDSFIARVRGGAEAGAAAAGKG